MASPEHESSPTEPADVLATLSGDDLQMAGRWYRLLRDVLRQADTIDGDLVALREQLEEVAQQMTARDPAALHVMALRYGLGGDSPMTVRETATRLGYTRLRVQRVAEAVLRELRQPIRSRAIRSAKPIR